PGLLEGGTAARRLGLPRPGTDADPGLARKPAEAETRPGARTLRDQLLGDRIPAGGWLTGRPSPRLKAGPAARDSAALGRGYRHDRTLLLVELHVFTPSPLYRPEIPGLWRE